MTVLTTKLGHIVLVKSLSNIVLSRDDSLISDTVEFLPKNFITDDAKYFSILYDETLHYDRSVSIPNQKYTFI